MKNNITIKLMEGNFTSEQAQRILLELLNSKIRFHRLEIFSAQETGIGNIEHSEQRIIELNREIVALKGFIQQVQNSGMHLNLHGSINIEAVKPA